MGSLSEAQELGWRYLHSLQTSRPIGWESRMPLNAEEVWALCWLEIEGYYPAGAYLDLDGREDCLRRGLPVGLG